MSKDQGNFSFSVHDPKITDCVYENDCRDGYFDIILCVCVCSKRCESRINLVFEHWIKFFWLYMCKLARENVYKSYTLTLWCSIVQLIRELREFWEMNLTLSLSRGHMWDHWGEISETRPAGVCVCVSVERLWVMTAAHGLCMTSPVHQRP